MFTGTVSTDTFQTVMTAATKIGQEVLDGDAFMVSKVVLIPEIVLPNAKMLVSYGTHSDRSALMDWEANGLLMHELKEVLSGRRDDHPGRR